MKKLILLTILFTSPIKLLALDPTDPSYQEVLEKYLAHGQMNAKEVEKQKINVNAQKKWRTKLKGQARDVASTLKGKQNILKLENPIIEISTK